jgi:hypothetical protein
MVAAAIYAANRGVHGLPLLRFGCWIPDHVQVSDPALIHAVLHKFSASKLSGIALQLSVSHTSIRT